MILKILVMWLIISIIIFGISIYIAEKVKSGRRPIMPIPTEELFNEKLEEVPESTTILTQRLVDISDTIANYLKEKGWSQKKLAEKADRKQSYISRVMAGNANLNMETIVEIEEALGEKLIEVNPPQDRFRDLRKNKEDKDE